MASTAPSPATQSTAATYDQGTDVQPGVSWVNPNTDSYPASSTAPSSTTPDLLTSATGAQASARPSPANSTPPPAASASPSASAPSSTSTADDAPVDLTVLLSCLTREDLELLLVQAIARLPSLYPRLLNLVTRPVDTSTLSSSLSSLLSFSALPSALTPELEPHVEQAGDYVRAGLVKAGLSVLDVLSAQFVEWVKQYRRGKEEETDDEYRHLETFFGLLVRSTSHLTHAHLHASRVLISRRPHTWRPPSRTLADLSSSAPPHYPDLSSPDPPFLLSPSP